MKRTTTKPQSKTSHAAWYSASWLILAVIVVLGFGLRAAYLRERVREPDFAMPALDPQFHDYWARALVSGDWTPPKGLPDPQIQSTPFGRPPGYPYFLAGIYKLTGSSYLAARIAQMGIGLINIVLAFLLARRLFGARAALIAALFMATYWGFIYAEGELESPVIEVTLALLLMLAVHGWSRRPSFGRALLIGVLFGLFILFRPNALLCAPVLWVWMAWVLWRRGQSRRWFLTAAVTACGIAALVAPVTVRNYRASGEAFLITYNSGVNLYIGNNEQTDCVMPAIPEVRELTGSLTWTCFNYPAIVRGIAAKLGKPSITYAEANRYFQGRGLDFIKQHPGRALALMIRKALLFWGPVEITSNKVTHYVKLHSATLRYLPGFPLVLALGLLGICLWGQEALASRRVQSPACSIETPVMILGFTLAYFATFLPFLVSGRFRVVLTPFLLLFGAYAVHRVVSAATARRFGAAAIQLALGCGLYGLAAIPWAAYQPEEDYYHLQRAQAYEGIGDLDHAAAEYTRAIDAHGQFTGAMPYAGLAAVRLRQGKTEDAIQCYKQALEIYPGDPTSNNNLGMILGRQGYHVAAADCYRRALEADPGNARVRNNLAVALAALGKDVEAIEQYRLAVQADPQFTTAYANLAAALARQGQFEEALGVYAQGLRIPSQEMEMAPNLGAMLEQIGQADTACKVYEAMLKQNPSDTVTRFTLASLLISRGEIESAVNHYLEVLKTDPNNRDAIFDLATVRSAQGKHDEAVGYYDRLLALDPNDEVAANYLGATLAKQGRLDESVQRYETALETMPRSALLHNGLGNAFAALRRFDEAIAQYRQALEINPRDATAQYNEGRVYALQGKSDQAVESYRKAIEQFPENVRAHVALADLLSEQGKTDEASEHYRRALEIDPKDALVQKRVNSLIERHGVPNQVP